GSGKKIADMIRERIKSELGITVSIGVSYNKIFAKLGSDMKKPDATTEIYPDNFRDKIWNLPASDLLFVGPATQKKLKQCGIYTIGDLAKTEIRYLQTWFGV
ncbi:MAG TPA: DNA polymerase IV, partial [Clostridiales bacterium]|nr:DNA polymerase IV [Clostridiales bacterium]